MRGAALETLGKLEPATLVQFAFTVLRILGDSQYLLDALDDWAFREDWTVRDVAMDTLRTLPRFVTSGVNFDSEDLRSRLLGRLGWNKCQLRLRVRSLALYLYALPYRPGGAGHAQDVEAWDQMQMEIDHQLKLANPVIEHQISSNTSLLVLATSPPHIQIVYQFNDNLSLGYRYG